MISVVEAGIEASVGSRFNPAVLLAQRGMGRMMELGGAGRIEGNGMPGELLSAIVGSSLLKLALDGNCDLPARATELEDHLFRRWCSTGIVPRMGVIVDIDGVAVHPVWDLLSGLPINRLGKLGTDSVEILSELARRGVPVRLWTSRFEMGVGASSLEDMLSSIFQPDPESVSFPFVSPRVQASLAMETGRRLEI